MKRKYVVLVASLIVILSVASVFVALELTKQVSARPFYVGVEFAFGNQFSQVKALVDQVKGYTNLFILGSVTLTFNRTALNESCNYIYSTGLNFIVFVTGVPAYNASDGYPGDNTIFDWMGNASLHYGKQLLGFYRFDEPGGNQIDNGEFQLIKNSTLTPAEVANEYVYNLGTLINYFGTYGNKTDVTPAKMFTSDYALYWFDYESGYSTVFTEFVGNGSRQTAIALDRGAAEAFNKNWGAIVTWNSEFPNPESKTQLLTDLSTAYSAGATYAVVFPFNITGYSYWTLPTEDFEALQTFWSDLHSNPNQFGSTPAEAAYIVPADFGGAFRGPMDSTWGLFPPGSNEYTAKIWSDTQMLQTSYPGGLNIIFDYPDVIGSALNNYKAVFYYNQTIS